MEWKPEYSVGEKTLDKDHKIIFDQINRFETVFSVGVEDSLMESVLDDLSEYTKYHFKREEQYMRKMGYPGLEEHQSSHRALEKGLDELYEQFHGGDTLIPSIVSEFLNNWLQEHILKTDKEYSVFAEKKSH